MGRFLDYARNSGETVPNATTTTDGFMSAEDKQRLDSALTLPLDSDLPFTADGGSYRTIVVLPPDTAPAVGTPLRVVGGSAVTDSGTPVSGGAAELVGGDGAGTNAAGGTARVDGGAGSDGGPNGIIEIGKMRESDIYVGGSQSRITYLQQCAAFFTTSVQLAPFVFAYYGLETSGSVTIDFSGSPALSGLYNCYILQAQGDYNLTLPDPTTTLPADLIGFWPQYAIPATIILQQDAVGGRAINFPPNCRVRGGTYTPSGPNKIDVFRLLWQPGQTAGTGVWLVDPSLDY